jgi:riboflavin kinase/FMN adenylyltransferase
MTSSPEPVVARNLDGLPMIGPAVITLGVFDGAHLGHRAALATTAETAAAEGLASVAVVLDPHPREVLQPGSAIPRLAPLDINVARLERLALVDAVVPLRFDAAISRLPAVGFLEALAPAIDVRGVAMAPGSAFGRNRDGTADRLTAAGHQVVAVPALAVDDEPVSSTRIRAALARGDVATAIRLGAEPYLRGRVVRGDRRGRELGFPTANLAFDYAPAMPAIGIYLGAVSVPERGVGPRHPALVSVGVRPTFHDDGRVLVEVYLLDFDGDLYDATLAVSLEARLREERRFDSVEALVEQMRADETEARLVLAGREVSA